MTFIVKNLLPPLVVNQVAFVLKQLSSKLNEHYSVFGVVIFSSLIVVIVTGTNYKKVQTTII